MIRCRVTSTTLTFLPISPSYALYNFSRERRFTSAHMETLDHFLGSRNQPPPCLTISKAHLPADDLLRTLVITCSQSVSHDNHVISNRKMAAGQLKARPCRCELASWLGQRMLFFVEGLDLQAKCSPTALPITEVRLTSHTRITRSHIRRHRNAEEGAEPQGVP